MKHTLTRTFSSGAVTVSHGGVPYAEYESLDHALRGLWVSRMSISDCGGFVALSGGEWLKPLLLIFHCDHAGFVPPQTVVERGRQLSRDRQARISLRRRRPYDGSTFRHAPVPGTGGRSSYGNWLRYMKTTQERRAAAFAEPGEPKARARRNHRNLPNAWDDRARNASRSWKEHRRHQWKTELT